MKTWESDPVADYIVTYPGDDSDGACTVSVYVGEASGRWYLMTADDAGGSDDAPDTSYDTREQAVAAAEELAAERDEGNGATSPEEYLRREKESRAGNANPAGEWCVYWSTALDDSGPRERYDTRDQAEAAVEIHQEDLQEANPGANLMCGYEVRQLVDGRWIDPDLPPDDA